MLREVVGVPHRNSGRFFRPPGSLFPNAADLFVNRRVLSICVVVPSPFRGVIRAFVRDLLADRGVAPEPPLESSTCAA